MPITVLATKSYQLNQLDIMSMPIGLAKTETSTMKQIVRIQDAKLRNKKKDILLFIYSTNIYQVSTLSQQFF